MNRQTRAWLLGTAIALTLVVIMVVIVVLFQLWFGVASIESGDIEQTPIGADSPPIVTETSE